VFDGYTRGLRVSYGASVGQRRFRRSPDAENQKSACRLTENQKSARRLTEMFRNNAVKKTCLAIVEGKITESGTADNFLEKSFAGNEEKIRVSAVGKRAVTFYRPLKLLGDYTLSELNPVTGRKHQLRVHCAETLKAPISGDRKYNKNPRCKELFLHAAKIFTEDDGIEITAEIPDYFQRIIDAFSSCGGTDATGKRR
jgi:23S rRNA-/tRNA-specific pseudouridylate synthase